MSIQGYHRFSTDIISLKAKLMTFNIFNILGGAEVPEGKYPVFKRDKASCGSVFGDTQDQSILDASTVYPWFNVGKLHHVDSHPTVPQQHPTLFLKSCKPRNSYLIDFVVTGYSPQNGVLSALPYICMYLVSFPVSYTADFLINKGNWKVINVRRIFVAMGVVGPGLSFIWGEIQ